MIGNETGKEKIIENWDGESIRTRVYRIFIVYIKELVFYNIKHSEG